MGIFKVWDSKIYDSKDFIRVENKKRKFLEKELKILEEILTGFQTNQFYLECKQKLEKSYAKKKKTTYKLEVSVNGTMMGKSQ